MTNPTPNHVPISSPDDPINDPVDAVYDAFLPHMRAARRTYVRRRLGVLLLSPVVLIAAVAFGAVVVNYAKAESFLRDEDKILGANVTDQISGATQSVRAQITLNAAGPWADDLLDLATHGDSRRDLLRSKGIHLITRGLTRDHAVTITIPEQMDRSPRNRNG